MLANGLWPRQSSRRRWRAWVGISHSGELEFGYGRSHRSWNNVYGCSSADCMPSPTPPRRRRSLIEACTARCDSPMCASSTESGRMVS
ncbi:MAG: hypothetical protein CM15mP77_0270 [Synechococcus sp.]|nr:MAG: hypothetical protein CM15mP77_0270 [Synechococcus sp.]